MLFEPNDLLRMRLFELRLFEDFLDKISYSEAFFQLSMLIFSIVILKSYAPP